MRVPPRWVRRVVIAPLVIVAAVLLLAATPLWFVLALALASLVPRFVRFPRVLWLVTVYLVWDAAVLIVMLLLWVASGFGWKIRTQGFVRAHYVVGRVALRALFRVFRAVLRLRIIAFGDDDEDPHTGQAAFDRLFTPGTPLIVASRHGGPGDSLILTHLLLEGGRREPRIVLKDTIRWDPAIDTLLSRVPSRFITPSGFGGRAPGSTTAAEQIGDLAMGLDENDALVIFPEGGQISPRRRSQRIEQLRSSGLDEFADRAEDLLNVMPPQPAGLNAALAAAPDADMIFIAHTGLDHFQNIGDFWRGLPMNKQLIMRAWRVPRSKIPEEREAQAKWLFGWFERIDFWIADRTATDDPDLP